jgi:hypothetical protein
MELLDLLLDLLDASAGAFGLATFWVTWMRPRQGRKQASPRASGAAADIDRFLHEASERSGSGGPRA